jgi:hypothetical protein
MAGTTTRAGPIRKALRVVAAYLTWLRLIRRT